MTSAQFSRRERDAVRLFYMKNSWMYLFSHNDWKLECHRDEYTNSISKKQRWDNIWFDYETNIRFNIDVN
jgi:hypothetical protein